ncbi:phospholipase A2 inhibitor and Ly6/PLAUR domain-containing protein-like [Pantherophis guttatus]|uniref:Phospholipase A2 inhibitor and Ly6/PLAUR domain-containing protein-like n=1 Tax=Pantherophis guttatus TaxID=94885 RepID=A0A6P9DT82_PANGU|nr:phospholipase A2 inhibitor and Ly6/PLAUR domain-containing protein-like [Pantherophis guttatus]
MRPAGILVFCLFSSILSTVTSLKCLTCVAFGTKCEMYPMRSCYRNEKCCFTLVANTTIASTPGYVMVKGCSECEDCLDGVFVTTTVDDRYQIVSGNCCQTDLCNAEPLHSDQFAELRQRGDSVREEIEVENYDELQPNELQCPGCFALDEDFCEANQTVICVGNTEYCIEITSVTDAFGYYNEKSTYQGCATSNVCSLPLGNSTIAGGLINFDITILECRNASSFEPVHL